ncbi:MAG: hypothetical protein AB1762_05325 [Gemmatimonadota bacterium]
MSADGLLRLARSDRAARIVGFGWGFAEGVVFFIVPDVYITFAALFSLRAGVVAWLSSILGSLVAVVIVYVLVAVVAVPYVSWLDAIPGISQTLIQETTVRLRAEGLPYTPLLIFGGVPLKVYAGCATMLGNSLGSLLLWTVFARIARIAPPVALLAVVRGIFRASIDRQPRRWMAAHLVVWTVFYVFYFIQMANR